MEGKESARGWWGEAVNGVLHGRTHPGGHIPLWLPLWAAGSVSVSACLCVCVCARLPRMWSISSGAAPVEVVSMRPLEGLLETDNFGYAVEVLGDVNRDGVVSSPA